MKITIDLPDELIREVKLRAVREGRRLKDVVEEIFRKGLANAAPSQTSKKRPRVSLPLIPAPPGSVPFDLSGGRLLDLEIEASKLDP